MFKILIVKYDQFIITVCVKRLLKVVTINFSYFFFLSFSMSPKSNKSLLSLITCEKCQCAFGQKDATLHESNCPPSFENWNHNFVINNTLHSTLEIYNAPGIYIYYR